MASKASTGWRSVNLNGPRGRAKAGPKCTAAGHIGHREGVLPAQVGVLVGEAADARERGLAPHRLERCDAARRGRPLNQPGTVELHTVCELPPLVGVKRGSRDRLVAGRARRREHVAWRRSAPRWQLGDPRNGVVAHVQRSPSTPPEPAPGRSRPAPAARRTSGMPARRTGVGAVVGERHLLGGAGHGRDAGRLCSSAARMFSSGSIAITSAPAARSTSVSLPVPAARSTTRRPGARSSTQSTAAAGYEGRARRYASATRSNERASS